jgi:hypothetical protein
MDVVVATEVEIERQNSGGVPLPRPGGILHQFLLKDNAPDGLSFKFFRSQPQADNVFVTPRHRHSFQQVRWTESGAINYGPDQYIREGEIAYFPRGTYYGPQVKDSGVGALLQFGFGAEHQWGEPWDSYRAIVMKELGSRGRFERGLYVDVDPDTGEERERDSSLVVYTEQYKLHTGEDFIVPDPGYEAPVLMHPNAFEYQQVSKGKEIKHLGSFFNYPGPNADIHFSMVRLTDGGAYDFVDERAQVAWTTSAGLTVDGKTYPELTWLYSPRGETASVSAASPLELYVIDLPRLD